MQFETDVDNFTHFSRVACIVLKITERSGHGFQVQPAEHPPKQQPVSLLRQTSKIVISLSIFNGFISLRAQMKENVEFYRSKPEIWKIYEKTFFCSKMSLRMLYLLQFSRSQMEIFCRAAKDGSHCCRTFKFGWCSSKALSHSHFEGFFENIHTFLKQSFLVRPNFVVTSMSGSWQHTYQLIMFKWR